MKHRYGKWTVLESLPDVVYPKSRRIKMVRARCACGTEKAVSVATLENGTSRQCFRCGHYTHGLTRHKQNQIREYRIWVGMNSRCHGTTNRDYPKYGGRGIYVCREWRSDFARFLRDMGQCPTAKHSIDRIDNDGPYSKKNCRWATQAEQARNTRVNNKALAPDGRLLCVADLARVTGVAESTIRYRIKKQLCGPALWTLPVDRE